MNEEQSFIVEYSELAIKIRYLKELHADIQNKSHLCLIKYALVRGNAKALDTVKRQPELYEKLKKVYEDDKEEYDKLYKEVNE